MALRMLGVFWLVMSSAGLITEYLFKWLGWLPTPGSGQVVGDTLTWNYTTILNIIALIAFGVLYWLYRNRDRFGGGAGFAKDPVCGMQVETHHAPASVDHHGSRVYFCSERCRDRFNTNPDRYVGSSIVAMEMSHDHAHREVTVDQATDPICGMSVDPEHPAGHRRADGQDYYFCCSGCAEEFDRRQALVTGPPKPVSSRFHVVLDDPGSMD
jgi:YHS domain-containing protein